jgi:hypothetical protein
VVDNELNNGNINCNKHNYNHNNKNLSTSFLPTLGSINNTDLWFRWAIRICIYRICFSRIDIILLWDFNIWVGFWRFLFKLIWYCCCVHANRIIVINPCFNLETSFVLGIRPAYHIKWFPSSSLQLW